jgi:hypothetical protein
LNFYPVKVIIISLPFILVAACGIRLLDWLKKDGRQDLWHCGIAHARQGGILRSSIQRVGTNLSISTLGKMTAPTRRNSLSELVCVVAGFIPARTAVIILTGPAPCCE